MTNLGRENGTTEFKGSMSQLDKGIMGLTAMLNKHNHGTLYIGVEDDGTVVGMDVGNDTVEKIRNKIASLVEPQVLPQIDVLHDGKKEYIRITCSGFAPVYSYNGRYFIREVTSNVQLSPEMLARMLLFKGTDPPREIASPIQDLTFTSFTRYLDSLNVHTSNQRGFFESHGLTNGDGSFNLVAYLMSDQNDVPLQVTVFSGTDKGAISSRTDYGRTSLIIGVGNVLDRIRSMEVTRINSMNSARREEEQLFDPAVFREAWINACVHNDWKSMIPPSVFVFDDRIEVQSYGRIPFMLSLEEFYSGKSMPVNKSLFDLFILADYAEQSGHGVGIIVGRYGRDAISMGDNMITVTIPFAFVPDWVLARRQSEVSSMQRLSDVQSRVLAHLTDNSSASIKETAKALGISAPTVSNAIAKLKGYGLLKNEGNNRINRWVRIGPNSGNGS